MSRRLLLLLLALLSACASAPPAGILGEPQGSGEQALGAQLARAALREPNEGPRTVFIGAALDGTEGVFDRDVALLDQLFARELGPGYRRIQLSNAVLLQGERQLPLALPPLLLQTMAGLAGSHRRGDRYVLLLTAHGLPN